MKLSPHPKSVLAVILCAWSVGMCLAPVTFAAGASESGEPEERRTVDIFQKLAPATLFISTTYETTHPLTATVSKGVGAGFIVDEEGRVLTNAHVVDGASEITVTLYDGTDVKAELLGLDPVSDVAVLQLPSKDLSFAPVKLGDSDHLQVGQRTLVVGSPFGLGFTLSNGIISGLGPTKAGMGMGSGRLIQTTAPINPGNSGGPLVDSQGRVIGMTTATLMGAQNIGFAIPINVAKDVLAELKQTGKVERPWLGVTGQFVTDDVMRLIALPLYKGLLVVDIDEDGPAVDAHLHKGTLHVAIEGQGWVFGGDIIVSVDGRAVPTMEAFRDAMRMLKVGQQVPVEIVRDGERLRGSLLVGERPFGSMKPKNGLSQPTVGGRFPAPTIMPLPFALSF
jgi:S1-C subfamily serine protease